MPHSRYEPEEPVRRPVNKDLIQLAGSDLNNQCINTIDKKQCGKRKRPGSSFCSPKCQGMYKRAHPGSTET